MASDSVLQGRKRVPKTRDGPDEEQDAGDEARQVEDLLPPAPLLRFQEPQSTCLRHSKQGYRLFKMQSCLFFYIKMLFY